MMETRRALEIVLSRVRMDDRAKQSLMYALASEVRSGERPAQATNDNLRAELMRALDCLIGVDTSFPKAAMIGRIQSAKAILRKLLENENA